MSHTMFSLDENPITTGIMRSIMLINEQNKRRATTPPKKPRYAYEPTGIVLHARRCLKRHERAQWDDAQKAIRNAQDQGEVTLILESIQHLPLVRVPVNRAILQDYSKDYSKPLPFQDALAA